MRRFRMKDIALGFGLLLLAAWSALQYGQARDLARWERASAEGVASVLALDELARAPEVYRGYARALATNVFPPNHTRAIEFYRRSILLDPLASVTWYELASELVLIGNESHAKASLRRSDQLDPHYPRQRLGAIQLWANLGDSERGFELAAQLSELGGRYRTDAVQRLLSLSLAPEEIYSRLRFDRLPSAERVEVIQALHVDDHDDMKRLFDRVDIESYGRPEWQATLVKQASSPLIYDVAVALWRKQDPELQTVGAIMPTDNLDLMRSPFERSNFFGWQNLSHRDDLRTRWRAPTPNDLFPHGFIQIEFPHAAGERSFDETIYRTPVASGVELKLVVRIRLVPATQPSWWVRLRIDGEEADRAIVSPVEDGWQRIELRARTFDRPGVAELVISRETKGQRGSAITPSEICVGRLEIEARWSSRLSEVVQL